MSNEKLIFCEEVKNANKVKLTGSSTFSSVKLIVLGTHRLHFANNASIRVFTHMDMLKRVANKRSN